MRPRVEWPGRDHARSADPDAVAECRLAAGLSDDGETSEASSAPGGALLNGGGGKDEDLGLAGCGLDVATAQGFANIVEFVRIVKGEIRRPAGIGLDQVDFHLGHELPFMYELGLPPDVHFLLSMKSSVHLAGSGR